MDFHNHNEQAKPGMVHFDIADVKDEVTNNAEDDLTVKTAWCLYLSHFLSMWISRTYEYATILFIQYTFPGDLLPSSINGIAETVCVLVSSAALGRWVDRSPSRLRPLLLSILSNRLTIVLCCALWLVIFSTQSNTVQRVLFAIILLLGMVEKAARISNMLSVERDWIPTVASYPEPGPQCQPSYDLTHLNTIIRRIDSACKFLAPLATSGVMILVRPWLVAILIALIGILVCAVEIWSASFVWKSNRRLRQAKRELPAQSDDKPQTSSPFRLLRSLRKVVEMFWSQIEGLKYWLSTDVWIPSLGIAILHASVLAWSGTLITWLLNSGLSYAGITVAKGVGSLFEIGSTFLFPWLVTYLSQRDSSGGSRGAYQMVNSKEEDDTEWREDSEQDHIDDSRHDLHFGNLAPIITTAKWSIVGLVTCLVPTLIALFVLDTSISRASQTPPSTTNTKDNAPLTLSILSTLPFFIFLSFSFLGRWTYDLAITQLTQITVPALRRSEFGGTQMALVSLVSMTHWVAAAIWHRQEDFKWLALGSVPAVVGAAGTYVSWARNQNRKMR